MLRNTGLPRTVITIIGPRLVLFLAIISPLSPARGAWKFLEIGQISAGPRSNVPDPSVWV